MKNQIPENFTKHLTKRANNAIKESIKASKNFHIKNAGNTVTTLHLLYALSKEEGSIAKNVLTLYNLKHSHILRKTTLVKPTLNQNSPSLSTNYKQVLKRSASYAMTNGQHLIGTEHLLYSILEKSNELNTIPKQKLLNVKTHLASILSNYFPINQLRELEHINRNILDIIPEKYYEGDESLENPLQTNAGLLITQTQESILKTFCENISKKAQKNELDPIIGREEELSRIIRTLSRRNKNNPLLVGDAGVGKTALVYGLAELIAKGLVPHNLKTKQIYSINLSSLLAGTVYRGEFEERMRDLIEEVSQKNIILFIDEIHMLVGAGAAQGSLDAANILKPALLKGEFQCIGATTYDEFKKSIEKDSALDRRFQKLFIKEQTTEESQKTLEHLKPFYEKYHEVKIPREIIKLCIDLSMQYMPQRALPDKALDILDEAASYVKSTANLTVHDTKLEKLGNQLRDTILKKENALEKEEYKNALLIKNRQTVLEKNILELNNSIPKKLILKTVDKNAVYRVVSDMVSIPIYKLTLEESRFLNTLEKEIKKNIIGQDTAVKAVVQKIKKNRIGLKDTTRPMGSFIFMGPSGVGKTELAKVISNILYNKNQKANNLKSNSISSNQALIRLDMSEFSESHTISRLIGAPPGYVGYEETGLLIDKIKKNPYSVVLFDEIEKAHPNIFNVLLQILEDGVLTDSTGKTSSFKNALIIMTSNIASDYFLKNKNLGFNSMQNTQKQKNNVALEKLREIIRPEIINRIDNILIFNKLTSKNLEKISELQIYNLKTKLQKNGLKFEYSPTIHSWIVKNSNTTQKGARAIRKTIEEHIEDRISDEILNKNIKSIKIVLKNGDLLLNYEL